MASREELWRWNQAPGLREWEMGHGGTRAGSPIGAEAMQSDTTFSDWMGPAPVGYHYDKEGLLQPNLRGQSQTATTRQTNVQSGTDAGTASSPWDVDWSNPSWNNPYGEAPAGYFYDNEGKLRSNTTGQVVTTTSLAGGGIFTRPTLAVVGERGPEVVMPYRMYLQWLRNWGAF